MKLSLAVVVVLLLATNARADGPRSVLQLAAPPTKSTQADDFPLPAGVRPKGESNSSYAAWCLISLAGIGLGAGLIVGVDDEATKGTGGAFSALGLIGAIYGCSNWISH